VQQSWSVIKASLHQSNVWILATVIGLMLVNWGIEARKWQLQISGVEQISFISAFRAILAGQALGFNTINRIGESAGRAAFLNDGNRMRGVVLSFVGSMAQIIVTFVMGALSLLYMRIFILDIHKQLDVLSVFWLDGLIYVITVGVVLFTLAYFRLSGLIELFEKIPFIARHRHFVEKLEDFHWKELIRLLSLSFGRYFVFLFQYYLLLRLFQVNVYWLDAFALVGVM
jgi:hypothetical protein